MCVRGVVGFGIVIPSFHGPESCGECVQAGSSGGKGMFI
jgi:hypothetical protein